MRATVRPATLSLHFQDLIVLLDPGRMASDEGHHTERRLVDHQHHQTSRSRTRHQPERPPVKLHEQTWLEKDPRPCYLVAMPTKASPCCSSQPLLVLFPISTLEVSPNTTSASPTGASLDARKLNRVKAMNVDGARYRAKGERSGYASS
ncbi:hypothetical protein BD410DRAFT_447414 [Rickenella mellea]|uniref:Uncharacterized protein n=1 Tax=Rickenella mellea TaxID=50990 RepID=A0A4Y7PVU3_9AGAM|nr:hypothetical protein BD410DRAFT_447414 [Rickenella mellea]